MSGRDDAAVLLWGGRGSGKSGFLGALWHLAQSPQAGGTYWAITAGDPADAASADYLRTARADLRSGTRRATPPAPSYEPIRVTARRFRGTDPFAELPLAFRDPAGEFADDPRRLRDTAPQLLREIFDAAGIIWLFDASATAPPELPEIVRQIGMLREANGGEPVRTPVAFCASKIDCLESVRRGEPIGDARSLVERVASPATIDQLTATFVDHRFFAISSRGTDPDEIRPIGLDEVLTWIHGEQRRRRRSGWIARNFRRLALATAAAVVLAGAGLALRWYLAGPPAEARRRAAEEAVARLDLARIAFREGAMDSVVTLLHGEGWAGPDETRLERDTLLGFAAYEAGFGRKLSGEPGDSLIRIALDATARAIDQVEDPEAAARIRFRHAEACLAVRCGVRTIRRDLQFVLDNARDADLLRDARERLASPALR